ncbi:xylan 1,4-beta-xylosidase [Ranunculus cassubicifolius]
MMVSSKMLFSLLFVFVIVSHVECETIVCDGSVKLPYCDKNLSYKDRAKDLVHRLTLDEKVHQIGDNATGVPRLNIPQYYWWSEALHGVSDVGPGVHFDQTTRAATSFPPVILTAASFNETLWKTIGVAVSDEARALHNAGLAALTYWSPTINVARDPRWGRITEVPGEDPYVIGRYAVNYVRGLQDVEGHTDISDPNQRPLKVGACCKHYTAYDVDNWKGVNREHFDAQVSERDLAETFSYPFEKCVKEGDVVSVMCSYNRVNGIPTCADPKLLKHTLRDLWNLHGYIVADCDSVKVMVEDHKYLNDTPEDAVAQAFKAGLDLDCGTYYTDHAIQAVKLGKLSETDIDAALENLYVVLMRLGLFDGSPGNYNTLGRNDVCKPIDLELAAEAARQGIVLLKNDQNTLPFDFKEKMPTIAVIGPHTNATVAMIGNYALKSGVPCRYQIPVNIVGQQMGVVTYAPGCFDVKCTNNSGISAAVEATKGVDATLLFMGLDLSIEAESLDREEIKLPGFQENLVDSVVEASSGPVVLIIFSAGGVDVTTWKNNPKVQAIVWAGYPGAEGGQAIVDVLLGKYNPAGRLPITWYPADYVNKLPMTSMPLRAISEMKYPGRTYKFYNGPTVYPFGYGLSYTTFSHNITSAPNMVQLRLPNEKNCKQLPPFDGSNKCEAILVSDSQCQENVKIVIGVTNTGSRDGAHVVILYTTAPSNVLDAPLKKVVGFKRVFVKSKEIVQVEFNLDVCSSFNVFDQDANELLPAGEHTITVGDDKSKSANITLRFNGSTEH